MFVVLYAHYADEKDQGRDEFQSFKEATTYAKEIAEEGYNVEILSRERTYEAHYEEPQDPCILYGLRPGIDFPITLRRTFA